MAEPYTEGFNSLGEFLAAAAVASGGPTGFDRRLQYVAGAADVSGNLTSGAFMVPDEQADTHTVFEDESALEAFGSWARMPPETVLAEIETRSGFLETLRNTGIREIPPVTEAIVSYYETVIDA